MNITPKNIYRGRNANGSSFRMEEWDFTTLANLELGGQFIMLLICMVLVSIASPILAILAIISFNGRFNFLYVLSIIFGCYFLYDCSHGWLGVLSLSFFASEPTIGLFVKINIASVVVSTVLAIFGGIIRNLITNPITKYDESTYNQLPNWRKIDAENSLNKNKLIFYVFIILLVMGSFFIGANVIPKQKGWVKKNIEYVSPKEKQEATQDSLKRALGDFKSQEERDAHFREMERRYGN